MAGPGDPREVPPDPADEAALPAGHRFDEYTIERTLGGGGFGITYLARDANLDLPVALKEYFPADLAARGDDNTVRVRSGGDEQRTSFDWGLERFLDEARALATFRHPNIVRVLRYFRANGTAYIVMEYESGQSLKRWVPKHAPLSQRLVLGIVQPLLDGLEQVHRSGFLHRDIKPDNIFVRADDSPVLLDFGSARRVTANKELTNIVSPGFAPFEQYHSHGHQGPWTDIYSMGAVMYWMVTGQKPMESAARVKADGMRPASDVADVSVYGAAMLAAIDWALQPEEERRPQQVAEFRAAVHPSGALDLQLPEDAASPHPAGAAHHGASGAPASGQPSARRNLLGTIVAVGLASNLRSVDEQEALRHRFKDKLAGVLRDVPEDQRIVIDAGDGAAICFMGDPEQAIDAALMLRDLLGPVLAGTATLRIGVHMGPVRVVPDINNHLNVIGDGLGVAQRVVEFAQPNQVLVSRACYDVISRITEDGADRFFYLGQFEDKHGRLHELYAAGEADAAQSAAPSVRPPPVPAAAPIRASGAPGKPLTAEAVAAIEVELARLIGPLARVLVHKARPLATTVEQLREALAPTIQEPHTREQFLHGTHGHSHPVRSMPSTKPRPSAPVRSGPSSGMMPLQPIATRSGPPAAAGAGVPAEELATLELALTKFIGPMARIVVRKEAALHPGFKDLVTALANSVDRKDQRAAFLVALHKALPRRTF